MIILNTHKEHEGDHNQCGQHSLPEVRAQIASDQRRGFLGASAASSRVRKYSPLKINGG